MALEFPMLSKFKLILFSGVNGPLGYALESLASGDSRFVGFSSTECDLRNQDETIMYFRDQIGNLEPSSVALIHLAAKSGGALFSQNYPGTVFVDNIQMAINSLTACRELGIRRVILTLSTACYADTLTSPTEDKLHEGSIHSIDYAYAYSKRMQEVLMRSFNKEFSMEISSVLVNGIVGPKLKFDTGQSILPASLIRDLAVAKKTEIPLRVPFDNRVRREYTYSFDLARAILWCLESQESNTLLNIGNTIATSIPELTRLIAKALQSPDELISLEDIPIATRLVQSTSNSEFLKLSNFKYTPLEEAIQRAVEWYLGSA